MKFVTYASVSTLVFLLRPDWAKPVELEVSPGDWDEQLSLNARSSRKVFGESLRYKQRYKGMCYQHEATQYRVMRDRLKDQPVAMPIWSEVSEILSIVGNVINLDWPIRHKADRFLIWSDADNFEIITTDRDAQTAGTVTKVGTIGTWPAGSLIAPLMFGRFEKRPESDSETDELSDIDVRFIEKSPYDRRVEPMGSGGSVDAGSDVAGFTGTKLLTMRPNFVDVSDQSTLQIKYKQIGFLREDQRTFYDQSPKRGLKFKFTFGTRLEASTLLQFFMQRRGPVDTFFIPTYRGDLRLKTDIASGSANITCERSKYFEEFQAGDRHPGTPYLCVHNRDAYVPLKATGISSPDADTMILTKASTFGAAMSKDETIVSWMHLVRFADPKITLRFTTDEVCEIDVDLIECAEEYLGTAGAQTTPGFLYQFHLKAPNGPYWRYTSGEKPLVVSDDGTYQPGPFEHNQIKRGVALDNESVEIMSWKFAGNPLLLFIPFGLETPLELIIYECVDINFPDNRTELFRGEVGKVQPTGEELKVLAYSLGAQSTVKIPNFKVQLKCNYFLFGPRSCKVVRDDFTFSGTITAENNTDYTITLNTAGDKAANYFANGWLTTGDGGTFEARAILSSAASGGSVVLTINRPLTYGIVGQAVTFWPGCARDRATCITKYNNFPNFGGHPEVPAQNPTIEAIPISEGQNRRK